MDIEMEELDMDIEQLEFGAGIKETFGEVQDPPNVGATYIFAQQWPSLAFAADALGLQNILTCVDWQCAIAREEFKATSLGSTLSSRQRVIDHSTKLMDDQIHPVVLIQGDVGFVESVLTLFLEIPRFVTCAFVSAANNQYLSPTSVRHITSLSWRQVSHKSMAGATTGSWLFGSSVNLGQHGGLKTSPLAGRSLMHVLKTTESGTERHRLKDPNRYRGAVILDSSRRAPIGSKTLAVETKSVFSKTPIVRMITLPEMMDVYDLELSLQSELQCFWKSSEVQPSRAFVHQPPTKVLFSPISQVLQARVSELASMEELEPLPPSPEILLQSELPPTAPQAPASFGMEPDSFTPPAPSAGLAPSTDNVKAVKRDDAKVNELDWDLFTVNNFNPPSGSAPPLICVAGSYGPATQRFFTLFRGVMLRAYKRRLLRGFLKHVNLEHDGGRRVPFSITYNLDLSGSWVMENGVKVWRGGGKFSRISTSTRVSAWALSNLSRLPPRKQVKRPYAHNTRHDDLRRDLIQGSDCIERAGHTTFWEWPDGSSIFFWRWPPRYKRAVRDGTKLFVNWKYMPSFAGSPRLPKDPLLRSKLLDKLQVPRRKRYICSGPHCSQTGYFGVPKGEDDIRVVYDATACGLNKALWSPSFFLPTIDTLLRNADPDTFYGDIDLGEMFLNYALDQGIRKYAGVDVTACVPDEARKGMRKVIERWERTLMGLRSSPYVCTQAFSWSEEVIRGNRLAKDNPLRWDKVVLNLPGDANYDPTRPRVYKWNSDTGTLAGSFGTYIDDIRTQHQSESLCRRVTRTVAAGVGYLGQQDAPRKRRPPAQRPGAWSGAMCFSAQGEGLYVTCSDEKWQKGKALIESLYQQVVVNNASELERSTLEKGVGFLVHLSRTFPALFPYLKGIYLTMESWRLGRDGEGWKFSRKAWWNLMAGALDDDEEAVEAGEPAKSFEARKREYLGKFQTPQPKNVRVVRRLSKDLVSLRKLFAHTTPPKRLVRGNKVQEALYTFGDASGSGFGSSWQQAKGSKINYRAGRWGPPMDDQSSNHRELKNLVDSLLIMEKEGTLTGTEAFIFTDNSVAESAFYKGTSSSATLFELVVTLRELEMRARCKINMIHVSGERMIAQGTDGLSRGNFTEGSMKGRSLFDYIPLAESALDRSKDLLDWIKSWTGKDELEVLSPEDWFERGHDLVAGGAKNTEGHWIPAFKPGKFVWAPPPAAADVAIEELRRARHKRQDSTHIFITPRLMKPMWHKQLCKAADIVLYLPAGHSAWPKSMFEPLTIGLCFPYLKNRPWELRRSNKLLELGRVLHGMWKEDRGAEGPVLRELWSLPRVLESVSAVVAREMLQGMSKDTILHRRSRKRRRQTVEEEEGRRKISPS